MQYLVIKNRGLCPIEGITILGVSSARGKECSIGQFGSGLKMGILTCLRQGLNPIVYVGREKIQFHTEPARMGGTSYNKVFVKVGTKAPRELSMALEYGELDWTSVDMAMREFVSNALDACGGDPQGVEFRIMERLRPDDDSTLVGVPLTPEVQSWYNRLGEKFLHFRGDGSHQESIIPKSTPGPVKIYRKGVYVRSCDKVSLFDYNLGEEIPIDESRNMDEYSAQSGVARLLGKAPTQLGDILKSVAHGGDGWELDLGDSWYLQSRAEGNKESWLKTFRTTFGPDTVIAPAGYGPIIEAAQHAGYRVIPIHSSGWYTTLSKAGIPTAISVCDNINSEGDEILAPTTEMTTLVDTVWEWLACYGMTNGKEKPPVKGFRKLMQAGSTIMGYYKDGVVYLNSEEGASLQTALEEVAHYVTGATDNSRDFQDFAFKFAARMMV